MPKPRQSCQPRKFCIKVQIALDFVAEAAKLDRFTSRLQLNPVEMVETLRLVDTLDGELSDRNPGFGVMAITAMLQLVAYLSRCYGKQRNPESRKLLRIAESISSIERNVSRAISLEQLVEISGMSRRNFIRTFEGTMGTTPINYLIDLRIREASGLLQRTDRSITDVAFQVGFPDSNYFSRQFRKAKGLSPREYRKQLR